MNVPTRWYSVPNASPVTPSVVRVALTASSSSHVVGMSASVRPAASHRSVLMISASVEKSFGAQ